MNFASRSSSRIALLAIILLSFAARIFRLPDANIWWDEGIAVWQARLPIVEMMRWTAVDVHPPLYFGLLHFWRMFVGESEFAVRFLSALIGVLSVVWLWSFGRLLFPARRKVALLAASWLALSRFDVWWSQEARMYALGGLLFIISLYFTVRLHRHPDWSARIGYLLSTVAALYTLYLLAFTLVIEGLFWLGTLRRLSGSDRWKRLGEWTLYQVIVLVAFAPWLFYAVPRMRAWSVQTSFDPAIFLNLYGVLLLVGESTHIERYQTLTVLVFLLVMAGVAMGWMRYARDRTREGLLILFLTLIVPPVAVWGATTMPRSFGYSPKPEARYLLPFALPFYLLAAWAFSALLELLPRSRWMRALAASLLALILVGQGIALHAYYQGRYLRDDYKSVSAAIAAHKQDGDAVFLHTDRPWPVFAFHWPHDFRGWPYGENATARSVEYWLKPQWEAHEGVWLVVNEDALRADRDQLVEKWFSQRAQAQHEWRFGSKRLIFFARTDSRARTLLALAPGWNPPVPKRPLTASHLRLIGWEQPLVRIKAGDLAHVAITLQREALAASAPLTLTLGAHPLSQAHATVPSGAGPVRLTLSLPIPATSDGWQPYILQMDGRRAVEGQVQIIARETPSHGRQSVRPQHVLTASFGNPPLAHLLGYDLTGVPAPGHAVTLTLYWRVENPTTISYKVFVHLIGADGRPAAQGDDFPLAGERPTTSWLPGEILMDVYKVKLPPSLPPGDYPLRIGFYDPVSGVRLAPVRDSLGRPQADDQLQLDVLHIE